MNDGMLLVNFAALQQGATDIEKALHELQSQLSQLESDANPLVATWSGAAQQAYAERQRKWTQAADDLSNILRNIKGAVEESAQDYQRTESQAQKRFE
jgi:early secretory antigenic target protein ESAT-6